MARHDNSLLEAALLGYQAELRRVTDAIANIQKRLGSAAAGGVGTPLVRARPQKKHRISAAGRVRIAEAQRKRWAATKRAK